METLKRELGFWDVFCVASGSMISSGLFVLPGLAFAMSGSAVVVAYFMAALLMLPSVLSQIEMATAMPRSGGSYFFIERSMGHFAGILGGFANWFAISFKSAFALIGIGAFATLIFPELTPWQIKWIAAGACLFFAVVNTFSVKLAGSFQVILVFVLITILLVFIGSGYSGVQFTHFSDFFSQKWKTIFATAGFIFISYGGLTKVASIAEEVKNPEKNIFKGMLSAYIVVSIIYVLAIAVTVGVTTPGALANSLTPISLAATNVLGRWGAIILSVGAILAFVTTGNAGIMSASRSPMAMSRDQLLPRKFQHTHPKFKTPIFSIFVTTIFMLSIILFLEIKELVKLASTLQLLLFAMVNFSVIVMRESKIDTYQPSFRLPMYPWLPAAGIIFYIFLIFEMGSLSLILTGIFIILSYIWYFVYVRNRVHRDAALIHLVQRVMAKEINRVGDSLKEELHEIFIEKNNIIEDRFDRLIRECDILDLPQAVQMETFVEQISQHLAHRLNANAQDLYRKFIEREEMSTTVIQPGLAIPHIIIEADHKFDILLVRCREGIFFPGNTQPVHAVFVLIGSLDERNYHLRALMAIAQITQEVGFTKKWMRAESLEELRRVILLSNRKRENH